MSSSEFHGILKHREGSVGHQSHSQTSEGITTSQSSCSDHRTPKKSILKVDSVEDRGEQLTRSSLKKDASYERQPSSSSSSTKPRLGSSSSSSEDITTRTPRTFSDVIIDPVPGQGRRSAPEVIIWIAMHLLKYPIPFVNFPKIHPFWQTWVSLTLSAKLLQLNI